MEFIDLFPVTIMGERLNDISLHKNQEYQAFLNNPKAYIPTEDGYGMATINQRILDLPLFLDLKPQIINYSKLYLNKLGHEYQDIEICNSWGTRTPNGHKSTVHNHKNSYISGVYYLSKGSNIRFFSPIAEEWYFLPSIKFKEANPHTYQSYYITPLPSLLLLFPSYLLHQIEENKGPDRFSISFNIIPKGEFGPNTGKLYL